MPSTARSALFLARINGSSLIWTPQFTSIVTIVVHHTRLSNTDHDYQIKFDGGRLRRFFTCTIGNRAGSACSTFAWPHGLAYFQILFFPTLTRSREGREGR